MTAWTYSQSTGELHDPAGALIEAGYSGAAPWINHPAADRLEDRGPIPDGRYTIEAAVDHATCGPCSLPLVPHQNNEMWGRSGFLIHGDTDPPGAASTGCIVLSRPARDLINASDVKQLVVTL